MACVGGGSNAIGIFHEFVNDRDVRLIGVEVGRLPPLPPGEDLIQAPVN